MQTLLILQIQFPARAAHENYGWLCLHRRFYTQVNCCCSKLIDYTRGAVIPLRGRLFIRFYGILSGRGGGATYVQNLPSFPRVCVLHLYRKLMHGRIPSITTYDTHRDLWVQDY